VTFDYEAPEDAALQLDSATMPIEDCVEAILTLLRERHLVT